MRNFEKDYRSYSEELYKKSLTSVTFQGQYIHGLCSIIYTIFFHYKNLIND